MYGYGRSYSYAQQPELQQYMVQGFYGQQSESNPGQVLSYSQAMALSPNSLMPLSYNQSYGDRLASATDRADVQFLKNTVSAENVARYICSSGASRFSANTRNPASKLGVPNLLRTVPPVPITGAEITFNDSDLRLSQLSALGCGPSPW